MARTIRLEIYRPQDLEYEDKNLFLDIESPINGPAAIAVFGYFTICDTCDECDGNYENHYYAEGDWYDCDDCNKGIRTVIDYGSIVQRPLNGIAAFCDSPFIMTDTPDEALISTIRKDKRGNDFYELKYLPNYINREKLEVYWEAVLDDENHLDFIQNIPRISYLDVVKNGWVRKPWTECKKPQPSERELKEHKIWLNNKKKNIGDWVAYDDKYRDFEWFKRNHDKIR